MAGGPTGLIRDLQPLRIIPVAKVATKKDARSFANIKFSSFPGGVGGQPKRSAWPFFSRFFYYFLKGKIQTFFENISILFVRSPIVAAFFLSVSEISPICNFALEFPPSLLSDNLWFR